MAGRFLGGFHYQAGKGAEKVEKLLPAVTEKKTLDAWQDTLDTLHLWTQVVGKIRLAQTPRINHWWNATLYVSARGEVAAPEQSDVAWVSAK